MALLDPDDWSQDAAAAWIGSRDDSAAADVLSLDYVDRPHEIRRIWLPGMASTPAEAVHFKVGVEVPSDASIVRARLAADAGSAVVAAVLNGTAIGVNGTDDEEATAAVRPGHNRLVITVRRPDPPPGLPPALVARFEVELESGTAVTVASDGRWWCRAGKEADDTWGADDGSARAASVDASGAAADASGGAAADASGGAAADGSDVVSAGGSGWQLAEEYGLHGTAPHGRSPLTYRPSPYLRKTFTIDRPIRRARLYATALGIYEARLNGTRVGDHVLTPGWTDYDIRLPYQTYDVGDLLEQGGNVLGAMLGDGWYTGNLCWFGPFHYGDRRQFLARLEVEHTDGSRTVVVSDGSWRVGTGSTRYADLQNGVVVDARLEPVGWDTAGFDDTRWTQAEVDTPAHGALEAQIAPPIRVQQEVRAQHVTRREDGALLVDFGQNLVGWVRLRMRGDAGTRVTVRHAEVLDHRGDLYVEALRSACATDEYVLRGDANGEIFEPRFTVHGFRYAEVVGVPGDLRPDEITAVVVYADMDQIGDLQCSDARLNQLQHNIVWGQRGNFLTVPTDCPQRDERLGWTGDAQVFASTAAFNYDVRTFMRKWMRDVRDGQQSDGGVPHVAPDVLTRHSFSLGSDGRAAVGAAGWADAVAVVPWESLRAYADRRLVAESYDAVKAWLRYLAAHSSGHIRPAEGFADWLSPTPTPSDLVATAFYAYAARLAAAMARELYRSDEAERWQQTYDQVRAAFRSRYVRGGGRVTSGTQTSYVLALHFGLLEPAEEPRALQRLVHEIESRNWHLSTGFLGTPYLLPVLSRAGRDDVAFRLLTQDTYPSWLYPVVHGDATTMWERWDSWSDSRGFQDPGMTSFNHYAYGAVGTWLYEAVGGIAPAAPGYRHVAVRPRIGGGITWARANLETVHGPVSTHWRCEDDGFRLDVTIPPNTTADVWLPTDDAGAVTESGERLAAEVRQGADGAPQTVVRIESGTYAFEVARPLRVPSTQSVDRTEPHTPA